MSVTVMPSATAAAERSSTASSEVRSGSLPRSIVWTLVASVATEVVLLRAFFRVGVFLPKEGAFDTVNDVLVLVGTFAFNLSSVLALGSLGWLAVVGFRHGRRAAGIALGSFVALSLLAAMGAATGPLVPTTFAIATVLVAWPSVMRSATTDLRARERRAVERLAIGLTVVVFLLSAYSGVASSMRASAPGSPPGAVTAQLLGELLIVATSFAFLGARGREGQIPVRAVVLGALPAVVVGSAWQANGAIAGILALWMSGLRLYLPTWIYLVAVWALATTVLARRGDGSGRAAGLVLLACAGFLLESTYSMAVALVALVLLADVPLAGRAAGGSRDGSFHSRV
jgi:hypothetical protein